MLRVVYLEKATQVVESQYREIKQIADVAPNGFSDKLHVQRPQCVFNYNMLDGIRQDIPEKLRGAYMVHKRWKATYRTTNTCTYTLCNAKQMSPFSLARCLKYNI